MRQTLKNLLNGRGHALLVATLVAACIQIGGCVGIPPPPVDPNEIDLFDPDVVKLLMKEPVIIPGSVLYVEVIAGGTLVLRDPQKIVSLRNEISLPLLGMVDCTGLTLQQLIDALKAQYAMYYNDPTVTATFAVTDNVSISPWGTVGVYGCVVREGRVNIPSTSQLSLTRAIQEVHGMTPMANRKKIRVTRTASGLPQIQGVLTQSKDFNYDDISSGKIPDPPLIKDDAVRVWETVF